MNSFINTINARKTEKYLAEEPLIFAYSDELINQVLASAHSAPFHYPCDKIHQHSELDSPLPWRAYIYSKSKCLQLRNDLLEQKDETKMPALLAAASHLIMMTWLPDKVRESTNKQLLFEPTLRNMEHIAAASSAVQNILVSCQSVDIPNYWSSGGHLAKAEKLAQLGIEPGQILLAAIFIFPAKDKLTIQELENTKIVDGKLRDKKGDIKRCIKWMK